MNRKRKHVYKVGDIVRIKNPEFVLRVGYPWDKEHVKKHVITPEQKRSIEDIFVKFGLATTFEGAIVPNNTWFETAYDKIIDEMAYWVLKENGFGGSERKLHTVLKEKYHDKLAEVRLKRVVKTGTYQYGSCGSYYYPDDCSPPYLSNEKTHVLLGVAIFSDDEMWTHYNVFSPENDDISSKNSNGYEIDSVNVEFVRKKDTPVCRICDDNEV